LPIRQLRVRHHVRVTDTTWMIRLETTGDGPRLAVKDCIDVAGLPTTHGCAAVAKDALPAEFDAPVVQTARDQGARLVGKTNLVELCRHADGVNPWSGSPVNPLDSTRIPGGSSSGSAVAVARDEADVSYGTDTGGSVRIPAACCGIAGLKTTLGRIPTHGVLDFSRSLDTVGPLARDVAGLALGMGLLEPGFAVEPTHSIGRIGRLRVPTVDAPVDAAVDAAVAAAELDVEDVPIDTGTWESWIRAANRIMTFEGHWAHRHLLPRADLLEPRHHDGILAGGAIPAGEVSLHRRTGDELRAALHGLFAEYDSLVLPTLTSEPPLLDGPSRNTYLTVPFNLAGVPAASIPVPRPDGALPASLQVVGSWMSEERLLPLAARIEGAVGGGSGVLVSTAG
jgi:amidase